MRNSLGAVDRLILDEAGDLTGHVVVIDSPTIANYLSQLELKSLRVYCDNAIDEQLCLTSVVEQLPELLEKKKKGPTTVLLRLPKSLGQLEEYTQTIAALPGVRVIAGGRVKHMTPAMNTVLASGFSRVYASLGRQKSRVLHAQGGRGLQRPIWPKTAYHEKLKLNVVAHGGTFNGTRLDLGTKLLLENLDAALGGRAIDLGCGSGLIASFLARRGDSVIAIDVSRSACQSTAATAKHNGLADRIQVIRNNALSGFEPASADLVACNPPFHVGSAKDSRPAQEMFRGAGRVLVSGGEMWTVFNSHLPYRDMLKHLVGPTKVVAQNPNFTVTRSIKKK